MNRKKIIAIAVSMAFVFSSATAFADSGRECVALGADLSAKEKADVLEILGVDEANNFGGRDVITVTNQDEHKYLDSYISSAEIGSKALSSVLVREKSDNTISVETHNITYCTEGMYRNALATAGVKGADVIVAAPFDISGTAALVGTIKAYEKMSGEEVSDDVIESSVDEVITTGEVGEAIGDKEKAEAIIAAAKEELAEDPHMSAEEIRENVQEAAESAGVEMSDENVENVTEMMQNMQDSGIDWDNLQEQSESIMETFENVIDVETGEGLLQKLKDLFQGLMNLLHQKSVYFM